MSVKVKICGIRDVASARVAVAAGTDFLGFNFVSTSQRRVEVAVARMILRQVGRDVAMVGVFRDAPVSYVNQVARELELNFIQLHGDENPAYVKQMVAPVIKVVRVGNESADELAADMRGYDAAHFLLDRPVQGQGDMINLNVVGALADEFDVFVAGGLNPDNLAGVVRTVRLFGVDVAGGIETEGQSDMDKIRQFVACAKRA